MTEEAFDNELAEEEAQDTDAIIRDAFEEAQAAGKDEDSIKMDMISAGATFKNVTRMYNQFMIDAGLAISKADKKALLDETLEGKDLDTEEAFEEAAKAVLAAVKGATERSSAAMVRSWGKANDLEVYKKPKSEGTGRVSFRSKFYAWLIENASATKDDALDYIHGRNGHEETSENVKRHESSYMAVYNLANTIHNK